MALKVAEEIAVKYYPKNTTGYLNLTRDIEQALQSTRLGTLKVLSDRLKVVHNAIRAEPIGIFGGYSKVSKLLQARADEIVYVSELLYKKK